MRMEDLRQEFLFDCKVRGLSKRTIRNYEKQTGYFLNFLRDTYGVDRLEDVLPSHIKDYVLRQQKRGCKAAYTNDLLKAVKCIFTYAFNEGYTPELLTKRVKNVREPKVLIQTFSEKEIYDIIEYYSGSSYLEVRNRVILMILFDTGIRISELMEMKYNQIQDDYFIIFGKGQKERIVPKSPIVSKWLLKYNTVRASYFMFADTEDYVFLSKNGRKLTNEAIRKVMRAASNAVGVNANVRVSPHTCRHTFAHQQLKNGLNLYSLSRLLGHVNVSITQRYLEGIHDAEILSEASKTGVLSNLKK